MPDRTVVLLEASSRGGGSLAAIGVMGRGAAIDGFRQEIPIAQPLNRPRSGGAVIDDPVAHPLKTSSLSHVVSSFPLIIGTWPHLHCGLDSR